MGKLPIQSAKFKTDLVVGFAFGLFFMTMAAEVILAVMIPYHLRFENVWQVSIARQQLFTQFDNTRSTVNYINEKGNSLARDENALLMANYDRLAGYLHRSKKYLTEEQCSEIRDALQKLSFSLNSLRNNRTFTQEIDLDQTAALKKMAGSASAPEPPAKKPDTKPDAKK